jgi:hypothetical protein
MASPTIASIKQTTCGSIDFQSLFLLRSRIGISGVKYAIKASTTCEALALLEAQACAWRTDDVTTDVAQL